MLFNEEINNAIHEISTKYNEKLSQIQQEYQEWSSYTRYIQNALFQNGDPLAEFLDYPYPQIQPRGIIHPYGEPPSYKDFIRPTNKKLYKWRHPTHKDFPIGFKEIPTERHQSDDVMDISSDFARLGSSSQNDQNG